MAIISPPAWLQAGSYPARTDRLTTTSLLSYAGFTVDEATPLRPRQGVRPSYQNYQLKVRAAATPNMTVIVSGGMAYIDNHDTNGYGTYVVVNDADVTLNVSAAGGAGQFRKDSVCLSVYDAETAGTDNLARLEIISGPYASSAGATVRGTIPPNGIILADLAIGPSQTSVSTSNITDFRNFTVALGGIAPIPSTVQPDHLAPGQMVYNPDLDRFVYGTSSSGTKTLPVDDTGWVALTLASGVVTWGGSEPPAAIRRIGNAVWMRGRVKKSTSGSFTNGQTMTTVPAGYRPSAGYWEANTRSDTGQGIQIDTTGIVSVGGTPSWISLATSWLLG